ncbi:hypothetical protein LNP04_09035 [Chryseobacterium sp. C-71]|uniref:hypothetical protein n=1 Tax=Chryseobacterium sp. C-71 TaxID=2893882 RepID=UPI001E4DB54B|nr:hypothetical protein [Chryseobacterium sp. C-71]UFH33825.1 hypothetical protein LNP04_09035 [Chryseobacterium sp. C-71]
MKTRIFIYFIATFFFTSYKAQTSQPINMTDYPNFYNQTIDKLDNIIPYKTNYYGQPLSLFLQALSQNGLIINAYDPGPFSNKAIKLMFVNDAETKGEIWDNSYVEPHIQITFQQPFNFQHASMLVDQYHWFWSPTSENFYKNLIVGKIEFWYVRGLTDNSVNPK